MLLQVASLGRVPAQALSEGACPIARFHEKVAPQGAQQVQQPELLQEQPAYAPG